MAHLKDAECCICSKDATWLVIGRRRTTCNPTMYSSLCYGKKICCGENGDTADKGDKEEFNGEDKFCCHYS
eukprot:6596027-Ditylum_brightwellii.AAC.1